MRVIALIEDPDVVRRILRHLGRWQPKALERAPPVPPGDGQGCCVPSGVLLVVRAAQVHQGRGERPVRASRFLDIAEEMWAIEAQAPPGPEGDALRKKLRDEKSRPVVNRIKAWLTEQRFLPESDIGAAIKYMAKHWNGLCVFLDEPAVPIDNNRTERGLRGLALGRNNFYGSHSVRLLSM